MRPFDTGTLWDRVTRATEKALASGTLLPLATDITYVADAGIEFPVRCLPQLAVKERHAGTGEMTRSPFLNPDAALRVADVSDTHVCLLNRFPVFKHHLLIVTRDFEDQAEPLNIDDFRALWKCMAEYEALGFYNGGRSAGASQRHKHLQMVSLPLAPRGPTVPIEPLLDLVTITGDVGCSSRLPFPHCVAPFPPEVDVSTSDAAELTQGLYHRMLGGIGLDPATPRGAYNLLLTRQWMLLVPRFREKFATISLNALAFGGHFLVQNEAEFEVLQEQGPLTVLQYVASP